MATEVRPQTPRNQPESFFVSQLISRLGEQPQRLQAGLEVTVLRVVVQFVGDDGLVTPIQYGRYLFADRLLITVM